MEYKLNNKRLELTASTFGGELTGIKSLKTDLDYLWSGNPQHWAYHSPILFPIVGRLNEGIYRHNGTEYKLAGHGFARLEEFRLVEKSDEHLSFELCSTKDTKELYPFEFRLRLTYRLTNNSLNVRFDVEAMDNELYFSIGAHPAFCCPLRTEDSFEDYYFELSEKETAETYLITSEGLFSGEKKPCLENENTIPLSYGLFDNDALVFDNLKSTKISIKSKKHKNTLTVDFTGFEMLGLWTKKNAPFVCIEPWLGHADFAGFTGELKEKAGIRHLNAGERMSCDYTISIEE